MTDTKHQRTSKADRPDESDEFPRMVFRHSANGIIVPMEVKPSGGLTGAGAQVDFIIVGNPAALKNALEHGWCLDASEAQGKWEEEQEARMRKREGKGGDDKDAPRTKNFRDIDQHSGLTDYTETADNPRPNEPDNAPFQNTPYVDPQTGDLPDPPTSPAERPVPEPIPPGEAKPPGQEGDGDAGRGGHVGGQLPPNLADNTLPPTGDEGPGTDKPPPGTDPPLGGSRAGSDRETDKDGGGKTDADKTDREKGAPPRGPGRPKGK